MLLDENFFSSLFINILIFIAYSLGILVLSSGILNSKYIKLNENNKILYNIVVLIIAISSSTFSFIYSDWEGYSVFIFLFIPFIFLLSHKFGRYFGIGSFSMICITIGVAFIRNNNINIMIINYVLAFLCLISSIGASFLKWRISYIFIGLLVTIYAIIALISIPVHNQIFNDNSYQLLPYKLNSYLYYGMLILFSFISSLIIFIFIRFHSKFILKSKNIETQTKYKNGFLISKDVIQNINEFIYKNNVNKAINLLITFNGIDELLTFKSASYVHELVNNMLVNLKKQLNKYTFLPYIQENQYFLFIRLDENEQIDINTSKYNNGKKRNKNDFLYEYTKILKSVVIEENIDGKKFKITLSANCIIYGIQSNKLNDINSFLLSSLRNSRNNSGMINLLDTESFYNKYSNFNKNKVLENIELFKPNEIEVSIKLDKSNNGRNYYTSNAMILKKILLDKTDFYHMSNSEYINDIIMCHISALSLKEFVHKKLNKSNNFLIIDYPYNIISSPTTNINDLINSITSYNVSIRQIILNIIRQNKSNSLEDKMFRKNLNILKKNNIKFTIQTN